MLNLSQNKKGSLNIGQIGKDLGLVKKTPLGESKIPEELKTGERYAQNNNFENFSKYKSL